MLPNLPVSLIEHVQGGRCVLFAGAGLSAWAGLPNWTTLLQKLVNKVVSEDPEAANGDELEDMISTGKLLEVAEYCKDRLGPRLYTEVLAGECAVSSSEIPAPHRIIAQLPFSAIVTTNYDKVIEQSYIRLGRAWPRCPTHKDTEDLSKLLFENQFFVLKAHGDIDRGDTLILTTTDYRETVHANPAFAAMFSALLLTKAILFVGYSISDPDFRMLLDRQLSTFRGSVPERYALMSRVGPIQRDILWRTARIKVLAYDKHDEVVSILEALRESVIRGKPQADQLTSELFGKAP
jgi:hypothetical protein